ncbi:MAG: hypothetical protein ACREFJ_18495, partial [Acetobacteraceae bacterium]
MPTAHRYRRVLVMVQEGHAEAPAFRLAAELAHFLALDLEGLFIEDEALVALSSLPFARELRVPGHTWQTLDPTRMLDDFRISAGRARQLLDQAAAELGLVAAFSVLRGDPFATLTERAGAGDILVLAEPGAVGAPALRVRGRDIFRDGRSGVLLLPARALKRRGSIALLLPTQGSGLLEIGAAIARAAAENLILIAPPRDPWERTSPGSLAEAALKNAGLPPSRVHRRQMPTDDAGLIALALRATGARLLVLDRAALGLDARSFLARLLAEAGAAVLLLGEPPAPGT